MEKDRDVHKEKCKVKRVSWRCQFEINEKEPEFGKKAGFNLGGNMPQQGIEVMGLHHFHCSWHRFGF